MPDAVVVPAEFGGERADPEEPEDPPQQPPVAETHEPTPGGHPEKRETSRRPLEQDRPEIEMIARDVRATLARLKGSLPAGTNVQYFYDQSDLVQEAVYLREVELTLEVG